MKQTLQEIYEQEARMRIVDHCIDYAWGLLDLLAKIPPDHQLAAGIVAAITATHGSLAAFGMKLEF